MILAQAIGATLARVTAGEGPINLPLGWTVLTEEWIGLAIVIGVIGLAALVHGCMVGSEGWVNGGLVIALLAGFGAFVAEPLNQPQVQMDAAKRVIEERYEVEVVRGPDSDGRMTVQSEEAGNQSCRLVAAGPDSAGARPMALRCKRAEASRGKD